MAVSLKINDNYRYSNYKSREIPREIILSEISFDTSGVTFYYRPDREFTENDRARAVATIREIWPDKFMEYYYTKFSLGEFIDMVSKLI